MASDDVRIARWDLRATAGTTVSRPFTATTAVTTVSVYTGGTTTDVDDLTGADEHPATVDVGGLGGTMTVAVPTGSSVPLRLVVDGAVVAIGSLTPSTTGAASRDDTVTIAVATSSTLTLDLPSIVSGGGGGGGAVDSVNGQTGVVVLDAAAVGATPADADLTAIAGLDSATAGAIASDGAGWVKKTYAQLKTALGLTKSDVGLGNVDNTADLSKPISTATQTALDAKAPIASPTLTGTPSAPTATAGTDTTQIATTAFVKGAVDNATSGVREMAADWAVRTGYEVGDLAVYEGNVLRATVAHTTGTTRASFNAANWETVEAVTDLSPSLHLRSNGTGGTTTEDTTSRLTLESYQALQAGFGEVIRINAMDPDSYQHIAWNFATDPTLPPDPDTNPLTQGVWMGAHYGNQFEGDPHGHWSMEVPGSDGQLRSRFEMHWCDPDTFTPGVDKTLIGVHHADFAVVAYAEGDTSGRAPVIRLAGASNEKAIEWNVGDGEDAPVSRRWHLLCDTATEAGSDAGSDFALRKYNDAGDTASTVMYVKRSTGNVTFGEAAANAAKVTARSTGNNHGFFSAPVTIGSAFAAFAADMPAATDRTLQFKVPGDANARFVALTNGRLEWGDGTLGRDVNLYRSAADFLVTDDAFVPARLFLNATTNAYISMNEQTSDPSAPSANTVRLYAKDNGAGKTQLVARFNTGAVQVIATEP